MIEPIQKHSVLLADIDQSLPLHSQVDIWWLGQSGYAIKTASTLFYVDLYLSEHLTRKYEKTDKPHIRMTESPLLGSEIHNATWVLSSHKHSDHLDPETIPALFQASPSAKLILPAAVVEHAVRLGVDESRLVPSSGDETLDLNGFRLSTIPCAHPTFEYDSAHGYPFLGFVIEVDGLCLYHSGDTLLYDGLAERLQKFQPDIIFLPINGTDARRDTLKVPPNMNAADAVQLASRLKPRLVIPHHYDMFTFNTANVDDFVSLAQAAHLPYNVLNTGERFRFVK